MAPAEGPEIAVLFASQTGTAEELAWDLARQGRRRGFPLLDPCALDDLGGLAGLARLRFALVLVATTGQGDPPSNMRKLWQELLVASLPKGLLAGMSFAVFGLGDSHYREFNYAARKLHARLRALGARELFRLGLGDEQHDFGLEQELDPWAEGLWGRLAEVVAKGEEGLEERPRYEVEELPPAAGGGSPQPAEEAQSFLVLANEQLCSEAHSREEQDVRNVRLLTPEGFSYEAGDVCVVWPEVEQSLVKRFVEETLNLSLSARVRIRDRSTSAGAQRAGGALPSEPVTLGELFSRHVDVCAVPPRRFFEVLARHTEDALHKQKLSEFASRTLEGKDALYEYCRRERRSAAEVMWDFWTARPPLQELLSCLPLMRPRRYSIASAPTWRRAGASPESLAFLQTCRLGRSWPLARHLGAMERSRQIMELCVAVVKFTTRTGREGMGLCSGFLARLEAGQSVKCEVEKGALQLPPEETPLVMVCPGTGLSPCRALVQQRHAELTEARPFRDLLLLGFRHERGDYLYGGEWEAHERWLRTRVAFSRDHEERKVYVQDLLEEEGERVCELLLEREGRLYVCGRSHPMPGQVFAILVEVLTRHRGLTEEEAAARLRALQRSCRYVCDTWG